jgi:SAM-dependent methyltransferase
MLFSACGNWNSSGQSKKTRKKDNMPFTGAERLGCGFFINLGWRESAPSDQSGNTIVSPDQGNDNSGATSPDKERTDHFQDISKRLIEIQAQSEQNIYLPQFSADEIERLIDQAKLRHDFLSTNMRSILEAVEAKQGVMRARERAKTNNQPIIRVFDVGCGTGFGILEAARIAFENGEEDLGIFVGVDFGSKYIAVARQLLEGQPYAHLVRFEEADITNPKSIGEVVGNSMVEVVHETIVLAHLHEQKVVPALQTLFDLLCAGGILDVHETLPFTHLLEESEFWQFLMELFQHSSEIDFRSLARGHQIEEFIQNAHLDCEEPIATNTNERHLIAVGGKDKNNPTDVALINDWLGVSMRAPSNSAENIADAFLREQQRKRADDIAKGLPVPEDDNLIPTQDIPARVAERMFSYHWDSKTPDPELQKALEAGVFPITAENIRKLATVCWDELKYGKEQSGTSQYLQATVTKKEKIVA